MMTIESEEEVMTSPKVCPDLSCLGGTIPHKTYLYQDYLDLKDRRMICLLCKEAGRPISDGTEQDAMRVGGYK